MHRRRFGRGGPAARDRQRATTTSPAATTGWPRTSDWSRSTVFVDHPRACKQVPITCCCWLALSCSSPRCAYCSNMPALMTRRVPSQLSVRQMSQVGPGRGFGLLDLEHAIVVRAPQLHVHRLAEVAAADRHRPPRGPASHRSLDRPGLFDIRQSAGQHPILAAFDNTTQPVLL
jgi:hypothetical protein